MSRYRVARIPLPRTAIAARGKRGAAAGVMDISTGGIGQGQRRAPGGAGTALTARGDYNAADPASNSAR